MNLANLVERIKSWEEEKTPREKFLLIILTLLLPLFLFYRLYYQPTQEKIKKYKEEITKLEMEIAKLESFAKKEKELEVLLKERKIFLEQIMDILPTEKEIPKLLKNTSSMAKQVQLEILYFTPKNEEKKNYYALIPFEIQLKGYFPNIIKYINNVESMSRLVTLESIEFIPQDKEEKMVTKCQFVTYKYTGEPLEASKK